ncbi:ribonuclease III [Sulfurimonas sp. MAG313]|nr:ribonuclease III [Sulfurimonas sp. MAG313]MDF1880784.1 ribonuclease III [Sulfurimonas sp. MAG313]
MNNIDRLEQYLDYHFEDSQLLIEALTHKSYKKPYNNERLEFLGDAVLDLVVGEYLYAKFPHFDEGKLSKMRASLVNEEGFTRMAEHIKLGEFIFLSNAEENNCGRTKPSLLSNAFEAVMGAVYLQVGLSHVEALMRKYLEEIYPVIDMSTLFKDFKTTLQELTQAQFGVTPDYKLVGTSGPDHKKEFEIAVFIQDKEYAKAKGKSKKVAQQEAAFIALDILKQKD